MRLKSFDGTIVEIETDMGLVVGVLTGGQTGLNREGLAGFLREAGIATPKMPQSGPQPAPERPLAGRQTDTPDDGPTTEPGAQAPPAPPARPPVADRVTQYSGLSDLVEAAQTITDDRKFFELFARVSTDKWTRIRKQVKSVYVSKSTIEKIDRRFFESDFSEAFVSSMGAEALDYKKAAEPLNVSPTAFPPITRAGDRLTPAVAGSIISEDS